jgi:hypothetical protein
MSVKTQFGLTRHHQGVVMILQQLGVDWTLLGTHDSACDVLLLPPNETDRQWIDVARSIPTIDLSGFLASAQGFSTCSKSVKHLLDTPWLQTLWDVPIHPLTVRTFPKGQSLQKSIWVDENRQTCHVGLPFWTTSQQHTSWMAMLPMGTSSSSTSIRPTERIHQTPYSLMRHVLHYVMIQACLWSGRPLLRKAYYPEGVNNIFMFRVDSDYGTQEAVQSLIDTCQTHEMPSTWFLHTEAHKGWLDLFVNPDIEVAVHGVRHQSRGSTEALLRNILQAKADIERETDLKPVGVAMPFGRYNSQIAEVYRQCNHLFDYASDFGFDSDNLPHWPSDHEPLQVPIHPICPGSFRRTKATEQDIQRYFLEKWTKAMTRGEPFIFYHHPMQGDSGVLQQLFGLVSEQKSRGLVETWTVKQWAAWWTHRSRAMPHHDEIEGSPWRVKWIKEDSLPRPLSGEDLSAGSYSPPKNPFRQWKAIILDELGQRTQ